VTDLFKKHPFLIIIIIALVLRLFSVVWSKGYMANDDHFETVKIAYDGIQNGLLDDNGLLRWNTLTPDKINRSPLYVLSLYGMMKVQSVMGINNLDSMMYLVRLIHVLLSLLAVGFGYKYVFRATGNTNYAVIAGLILAGHFLMPYLSARTLIEKVAEAFLVPGVYYAYTGSSEKKTNHLVLAGILCGLSWMIRFNVAITVACMAPAIWYYAKSIRPAIVFCLGVIIMIVFSGFLDLAYLGRFGNSTLNLLGSISSLEALPPLAQPFWIYIPLIFGIFIPPFSIYFIISFFKKHLIREHIILLAAVLSFIVAHCLITHKEERYMVSMFSLLTVMGTIGLHGWLSASKTGSLTRRIFKYSVITAIVLNIILLVPFTFNYAHKGMVEPLVYLSKQHDVGNVLIDRTERYRLIPESYAGFETPPLDSLDSWSDLYIDDSIPRPFDGINYVIIYSDNRTDEHIDSLHRFIGPLEMVFHSTPSTIDRLLHFLNPKHNHTNEARVFRRLKNMTPVSKDG